jgi:hypothetical protein
MRNDRDTRLILFEDKLALKRIASTAGVPCAPTLARLNARSVNVADARLQVERFVLKTNHGWNDIVFVERLAGGQFALSGPRLEGEFNLPEANDRIRAHFTWWMGHSHAPLEWASAMIHPRVLFAEPWLPSTDDFKVFVINGRAEIIMPLTGRWSGNWVCGYFDRDWALIGPDSMTERVHGRASTDAVLSRFPRPGNLSTLLALAERIVPPDMTFLRVDFLQTSDHQFVLGEATAYSSGGFADANERVEQQLGRILWRALGSDR